MHEAGFVTALSLQSQVSGAQCHQAAAGSPQGLQQSSALAAAEEKLQCPRWDSSLKGPGPAPAGPPGMLDVDVSHLLPLRHQESPGVERFQVVEMYKEFLLISTKSGADGTRHKGSLALERGRTAILSPQKVSLWEGSGIAVLTNSRAVLLYAHNSSKTLAQTQMSAGWTQL